MREDCCDLSCFLCFESSQVSYIQDESIRLDTLMCLGKSCLYPITKIKMFAIISYFLMFLFAFGVEC